MRINSISYNYSTYKNHNLSNRNKSDVSFSAKKAPEDVKKISFANTIFLPVLGTIILSSGVTAGAGYIAANNLMSDDEEILNAAPAYRLKLEPVVNPEETGKVLNVISEDK